MASKKKRLTRMVEETMDLLMSDFKSRIVSTGWYKVPSTWISPHAEAVIVVEVKRENRELINTMYDVIYKQMFSRNFDHIVCLKIKEHKKMSLSSREAAAAVEDEGEMVWATV